MLKIGDEKRAEVSSDLRYHCNPTSITNDSLRFSIQIDKQVRNFKVIENRFAKTNILSKHKLYIPSGKSKQVTYVHKRINMKAADLLPQHCCAPRFCEPHNPQPAPSESIITPQTEHYCPNDNYKKIK